MSVVSHPRAAKSSNRSTPGRAKTPAKISLTAAQKRLIRTSFLKLAPALDLVGQLYFLKLFRLDPEFRLRFGADPQRQGRPFVEEAQQVAVEPVDRLADVVDGQGKPSGCSSRLNAEC